MGNASVLLPRPCVSEASAKLNSLHSRVFMVAFSKSSQGVCGFATVTAPRRYRKSCPNLLPSTRESWLP